MTGHSRNGVGNLRYRRCGMREPQGYAASTACICPICGAVFIPLFFAILAVNILASLAKSKTAMLTFILMARWAMGHKTSYFSDTALSY